MSRIEKSLGESRSNAGNIILNQDGVERACRIYCEELGIDHDVVAQRNISFADLLTAHMEQLGFARNQKLVCELFDFPTGSQAKANAELVLEIMDNRTMHAREIIAKPGNAEQLSGIPRWTTISSSFITMLAQRIKQRLGASAPIIPADQPDPAEVFRTELKLDFPGTVSAEGIYGLIKHYAQLGDRDFMNGDKPCVSADIKTGRKPFSADVAKSVCEICNRTHAGKLSALREAIKQFFAPQTIVFNGNTISAQAIEYVPHSAKNRDIGTWKYSIQYTDEHGASTQLGKNYPIHLRGELQGESLQTKFLSKLTIEAAQTTRPKTFHQQLETALSLMLGTSMRLPKR